MTEMSIAQACRILGVTEKTSAQDLRTARRALVRANHPDLVARYERAKADRRLSDINTAFDVMIALASTRVTDASQEAPGPHVAAAARKHAQRNAAQAQAQAQTQTRASAPEQQTASAKQAPPKPSQQAPNRVAPRVQTTARRTASHTPNHTQGKARRDFETALNAVSRKAHAPTRAEYA